MELEWHIRSVARSLDVLRAVNGAGSLSMMQIARRCAIPYPTARRIVHTLQQEGMLEREPSRKHYRPTALVQALSHGYQDHSGIVEISRPHLEALTRKHCWPVSLVTRVGQTMVVRDCTHAMSPMALNNYQAGATFPLLECASGHVMLAYATPEQRALMLRGATESGTPLGPSTRELFEDISWSETIRAAGIATRSNNRFTNTPGRTSSIAVPIFHNGEVCAALTLVYFSVSMRPEVALDRYANDLKKAADAVTLRLTEHDTGRIESTATLKRDVQGAKLGVA